MQWKKIIFCILVLILNLFNHINSYYVNINLFKAEVFSTCNKYPKFNKSNLESKITKFINHQDTDSEDKSILNFFLNIPFVNICNILGISDQLMLNDIADFYNLDFIEGYEFLDNSNIIYVTLKKSFNFNKKEHIKRIFMCENSQYNEIITINPKVAVLLRKENNTAFSTYEISCIDYVLRNDIKKDILYSCKT